MPDREIIGRLYSGVEAPPVKYVAVNPSWFEKILLVIGMLMIAVMAFSLYYLSSIGAGNRNRLNENKAILCYSISQTDHPLPPDCGP